MILGIVVSMQVGLSESAFESGLTCTVVQPWPRWRHS